MDEAHPRSVEVEKQAFMDIKVANNPALAYGADGILGLGFDSLSTIDALVNMTGSSSGRTFLDNAFAKNKSEPNFISFTLEDTENSYDSVQGYFSIGEYNPDYKAVADTDNIWTWPEANPTRWSVLLDSLLFPDSALTLASNVSGVSGAAVVVLDSGTSYSYVWALLRSELIILRLREPGMFRPILPSRSTAKCLVLPSMTILASGSSLVTPKSTSHFSSGKHLIAYERACLLSPGP